MEKRGFWVAGIVVGLLGGALGVLALSQGFLGSRQASQEVATIQPASMPEPEVAPALPPKRITERPGNLQGSVMVVMYHQLGPTEKYMVRSYDNFRKDLNRLYEMGYRPVTMAEYAQNKMSLAPGASPVVLTFDDSWISQFRMLPDGTIDRKSFVGIWEEFAQKHPDFPVKGTFYVLPNGPFEQKNSAARKLELLRSWGSEIASHTIKHYDLRKKSDEVVKKELAESAEFVRSLGWEPVSLALPYGSIPRNTKLLEGFEWNGKRVKYQNVVLAGSAPNFSPNHRRFNPLRIWRVQAYPGVMGIDYWLDKVEAGESKPYVQP
ncbi:MAG: polysaccharide deacetylase family protein [Fimbriimonadaceae bacterium]|nr:polysaccharide deacetylase family protein [Fimbriimonadaceae bacterium]